MEYTEVLDKQITRKQHYVPKAYLKNFSVSNQKSEQVYVVFANDENAKMVSIDNICCRSYLYDQIANKYRKQTLNQSKGITRIIIFLFQNKQYTPS